MTSVLNVDTIADKAGTGPVTLTKQSAAKSILHYNHQTPVVRSSFNVSSITDDATGDFQINYTSSFSDIYYSVHGSFSMNYGSSSALGYSAHTDGSAERAPQTSNCFMSSVTLNGSNYDAEYNMLATHGDLA